jgi:lipopolysaccharide/colanic/teichoic acid biosynthesis glycosyltransferase
MPLPSPTSRSGRRIYLSVWDVFWALTCPIVALYLRHADVLFRADWSGLAYFWLLSAGFAVLALFAFRLQDGMTRFFSVHEAIDIAEAVLFVELLTFLVLFTLARLDGIPRSLPLTHGLLLAGGLIAARLVVRIVLSEQDQPQDYRRRRERLILIGANGHASAFIRLLSTYASQRQPVIAILDDSAGMVGRAFAGVQILGAPHELDAVIDEFAIHGVHTDRVVIAGEADLLSPAVLRKVERICQRRQIALSLLPRMIGVTEWMPSAGSAEASTSETLPTPRYLRLKRALDVLGSLVLIVLLSPILFVAGLLVFVDIGRPILFWQERMGWRGRAFLIYKFRTLRAPFNSGGAPNLTARQPSAIGRLLRATRIDELPQLFNVLLGDMSLIGPRPLLPEDQPANTVIRLSVRPGVSGWAQVHGGKLVTKEEKELLDEWYVRNVSFWLDLRIAWMTLKLVLTNRLSSTEALVDVEQVQGKALKLNLVAREAELLSDEPQAREWPQRLTGNVTHIRSPDYSGARREDLSLAGKLNISGSTLPS